MTMSGIYSGVQATIKVLNPLIEYVIPYAIHFLNLVRSCVADSYDGALAYIPSSNNASFFFRQIDGTSVMSRVGIL